MLRDLGRFWKSLGRVGQIFAISLAAYGGLQFADMSGLAVVAAVVAACTGAVLAFRAVRLAIRQSIWRLRNRLLVAYVFIALVPIVLIATLVFATAWVMSGQIGVYLGLSEFDRRLAFLRGGVDNILRVPPAQRTASLQRLGEFFQDSYPGLEIVIEDGEVRRFPSTSQAAIPDAKWAERSGFVQRDGELYYWTNVARTGARATLIAPVTGEWLDGLVPSLGFVSIDPLSDTERAAGKVSLTKKKRNNGPPQVLASALNALDREVRWGSLVEIAQWEKPGETSPGLFSIRTRVSSVLQVIFSQKNAWDNGIALIVIRVLAGLFLIVEVIALIIGVSLSRSITAAVHDLYEGTERVMEGDFTHRIRVRGKDQLATLSQSFNRMTENLEQLLKVAKEKERYEAELEIAREIQRQLYPSSVPDSATLRLSALYKPARMVSGDYYDYQRISSSKIGLAMGDVAGKGISAALLMATIQSSFRTQVKTCIDQAQAASNDKKNFDCDLSTSQIVSVLNQHLHKNTPPEKFATFFFAVFDESSSELTCTNAGHLQPILVRKGEAHRLEVDGMVIGAFPFARFGESSVKLEPGDLIVCFTDGISEPENEYGEMFGEDRLTDMVLKNAHRSDAELMNLIVEDVMKWTGSDELQDDMTLLMIRRL